MLTLSHDPSPEYLRTRDLTILQSLGSSEGHLHRVKRKKKEKKEGKKEGGKKES